MFKKFGIVMAMTVSCLTLAACGGKTDNNATEPVTQVTEPATEPVTEGYKDVACADLENAVATGLEGNYMPTMLVEEVEHLGLTSDMYVDFCYKMPMISVNVDTLIIVKAAEGKVADVEKALNTYRDSIINDSMQYPMNLVKTNNSIIRVFGDYVAFIQLGGDVHSVIVEAQEKNPNISDEELEKVQKDAVLEQNNKAAELIENTLLGK